MKKYNGFRYNEKPSTKIFMEDRSEDNSYVSKANYLYGYDNLELVEKKRFIDVILLLFTSELPSVERGALFEKLAVGMINPGTRHPATRASMTAGVSKAGEEHLLPIGLTVLGGAKNGGIEVRDAMNFIKNNLKLSPIELAKTIIEKYLESESHGEVHLVPGFGNLFGGVDLYTVDLAKNIMPNDFSRYPFLSWCIDFVGELEKYNFSWLRTGLCAAVFCELSIGAREGVSLFQIICAPGIAAHGLEQSHNQISAMPLIPNEEYNYIGKKYD